MTALNATSAVINRVMLIGFTSYQEEDGLISADRKSFYQWSDDSRRVGFSRHWTESDEMVFWKARKPNRNLQFSHSYLWKLFVMVEKPTAEFIRLDDGEKLAAWEPGCRETSVLTLVPVTADGEIAGNPIKKRVKGTQAAGMNRYASDSVALLFDKIIQFNVRPEHAETASGGYFYWAIEPTVAGTVPQRTSLFLEREIGSGSNWR